MKNFQKILLKKQENVSLNFQILESSRFADACEKQPVTWFKPKPNVTIMFERSRYEDASVSVLLVV